MSYRDNRSELPRCGVVGANGRLGKSAVELLRGRTPTMALGRNELDLGNEESIRAALVEDRFDVLIITAAMTAVDECERCPQLAHTINAEGPGLLAEICAERGIRVVYVSTDYVFDGTKAGAYQEVDETNPTSVYGASKLEGERRVLAASDANLSIRVAWLYGSFKAAFPEWIITQALEKEHLELPADKVGSPTCCEDVVAALPPLIGLEGYDPAAGVLHFSNAGSCTWQEWGQFCVDQAASAGLPLKTKNIGANRLEDVTAFVAPRPRNSVLSTARLADECSISPRPWQEALTEHLSESRLLRDRGSLNLAAGS